MSTSSARIEGSDRSAGPYDEPIDILKNDGFAPLASAGFPLQFAQYALAAIETAAVIASAFLAKAVYLDYLVGTNTPFETFFAIAACMSCTIYVFFHQMGLYSVESLTGPQIGVSKIIGGIAISFLTVLGLLYALKEIGDLSRGWVGVWFAITATSVVIIRLQFSRWVKRNLATGMLVQRIAIIGKTEFALPLAMGIRQSEGLSGAVDLYHCGSEPRDLRFVGGLSKLEAVMSVRPYDKVIVAIPANDIEAIRWTVRSLGAYSTELLLCTDMARLPLATSGSRQIGGTRADVIHLLPQSVHSALVKRTIDILFAAAGLAVLSPLLVLAAIAIKCDSSGPILFRQRRLGQNSSTFRIFKFRSMFVEEDGPVVVPAKLDDKRVTRVGRILRWTSIDELPQLINVLIGDMSLVGPRPHAVAHDHEFEQQLDLFSRRRRVKPGITGWAQVNGFRGEVKSQEDLRRRMEHDLYYIENWSIWFDIEIVVRTLAVVVRGAY